MPPSTLRSTAAFRERAQSRGARALAIACVLLTFGGQVARAQGPDIDGAARHTTATRRALDSVAAAAEAAANDPSVTADRRASLRRSAAEVRARLTDGDFRPGDRIIVVVAGDSLLTDTFTVQPNRALALPKIPPIGLQGVLRSELHPFLAGQLREYVRDTLLRASPLVLVGVLGEVARPGYYHVPLEIALGEALMAAGGPTPQADMTRMTVRRGSGTILPARVVREAMASGTALEQLGIDAGDELLVVAPRARNWPLIMQLGGLGTGLVLALHALRVF